MLVHHVNYPPPTASVQLKTQLVRLRLENEALRKAAVKLEPPTPAAPANDPDRAFFEPPPPRAAVTTVSVEPVAPDSIAWPSPGEQFWDRPVDMSRVSRRAATKKDPNSLYIVHVAAEARGPHAASARVARHVRTCVRSLALRGAPYASRSSALYHLTKTARGGRRHRSPHSARSPAFTPAVHCAAQMAPIAKVGGLGDVVQGLALASRDRGHNAVVFLPFYGARHSLPLPPLAAARCSTASGICCLLPCLRLPLACAACLLTTHHGCGPAESIDETKLEGLQQVMEFEFNTACKPGSTHP